jgi:hypothetical protein
MQSPHAPNLSALGWLARLRWDLPSAPLYPEGRQGSASPEKPPGPFLGGAPPADGA